MTKLVEFATIFLSKEILSLDMFPGILNPNLFRKTRETIKNGDFKTLSKIYHLCCFVWK
jgi:hypothetical protein